MSITDKTVLSIPETIEEGKTPKKSILNYIKDEITENNISNSETQNNIIQKLDNLEDNVKEIDSELKKYLGMIIRLYEKVEEKPVKKTIVRKKIAEI